MSPPYPYPDAHPTPLQGGREPALDALIADSIIADEFVPPPTAKITRSCSWGHLAEGAAAGASRGGGAEDARKESSDSFVGHFRQPGEAAATPEAPSQSPSTFGLPGLNLGLAEGIPEAAREVGHQQGKRRSLGRSLSFDRLAEGVACDDTDEGHGSAGCEHVVGACSRKGSSRKGVEFVASGKLASAAQRQSNCTSRKGSGKYF